MKYMISWFERPQGSPMEYENAQKRILASANGRHRAISRSTVLSTSLFVSACCEDGRRDLPISPVPRS